MAELGLEPRSPYSWHHVHGVSFIKTVERSGKSSVPAFFYIFGKGSLCSKVKELWIFKKLYLDFPGGIVVKNLPANAGDTGSSPGPGRSHMPRSN